MSEIQDVVPGSDVESTWGNLIKDRTLQRYSTQATLDASILTPSSGEFAYVVDESAVKVWTGASWDVLLDATSGDALFLTPAEGDAAYVQIVNAQSTLAKGSLAGSEYGTSLTTPTSNTVILSQTITGLSPGVQYRVVATSFMRTDTNPDGSRWFSTIRIDGDAGTFGAWIQAAAGGQTFLTNNDNYPKLVTPAGTSILVEYLATINAGVPAAFNHSLSTQVYIV